MRDVGKSRGGGVGGGFDRVGQGIGAGRGGDSVWKGV